MPQILLLIQMEIHLALDLLTKSSKATCNYKIHLGGSPVSPLVE